MKYLDENAKCIISGSPQPDPCHVYTRKAYPQYKLEKWNIIPMAHRYHVEQHAYGWMHMMDTYQAVMDWLYDHGWEILDMNGRRKLIRPLYLD